MEVAILTVRVDRPDYEPAVSSGRRTGWAADFNNSPGIFTVEIPQFIFHFSYT